MRALPIVAALLAATAITPAYATALVAGSGWVDDEVDAAATPSSNSPYTFTLTQNGIFSVVDCCIVGDVYTLSGDLSGTTTFYAGSPTDVQASGAYGFYWTDASYSKIALLVGPGTYSVSIAGDCAGGCPAGFGVRLDLATVPEPATWGLMIAGFGLTGTAMRRRKVALAA